MAASVVRRIEAALEAFCKAVRVTLTGSIIPSFIKSSENFSVKALKPAFSLSELRDFTGMVDKAYDTGSIEFKENVQTLANYLTTYFFVNKQQNK